MKSIFNKIGTILKLVFNPPVTHPTKQELETGWLSDKVTCDICIHSWVAVYHEDCEKLECPNCEQMTNFEEGGVYV